MKGFKLNVPALVSEHVHHELQVFCIAYVFCHDCEVVTIQKQLTKKLSKITQQVIRIIFTSLNSV